MVYLTSEDGYVGPLEKLLTLVEEKKLEVTAINLAKVTGDFLDYFQKIQETAKDDVKPLLADFLLVVARLLLIKSKVLLPDLELTEEEEADIRDLEFRLKIYKDLKGARRQIMVNWRVSPLSLAREPFASEIPVFHPPKLLTPSDLKIAMEKMAWATLRTLMPKATVRRQTINLRDKIEQILQKITAAPSAFRTLHETGSRGELVVLFLAVLHLVRDNMLHAFQENHFAEIHIAKKSPDD